MTLYILNSGVLYSFTLFTIILKPKGLIGRTDKKYGIEATLRHTISLRELNPVSLRKGVKTDILLTVVCFFISNNNTLTLSSIHRFKEGKRVIKVK